VRVVSDRWLQSESSLPLSFRQLVLPDRFPPPTELLDLQPLPLAALRDERAERALARRSPSDACCPGVDDAAPRLAVFNPVQTQAFGALYRGDGNVLLAAPAGSGKTVAAELAILRMLQRAAQGACPARCVCVVPSEEGARQRALEWRHRFGPPAEEGGLGLTVVELAGPGADAAADLKRLERAQIAVATPEAWEALSRRWRQRKAVQAVSLFIADDLHLVGGPKGPAYEVAVSRMRYLAAQHAQEHKQNGGGGKKKGGKGSGDGDGDNDDSSSYHPMPRIVGLAHSMADAKDVGEWIGAPPQALFAFPPGARPLPLEVRIQAFDSPSFEARQRAMLRPCYAALLAHAPAPKPALVFVPTRKHARLAALELLAIAAADGEPARFRLASEADVRAVTSAIGASPHGDGALAHALIHGVGYLHPAQAEAEREAVLLLYGAGAIRVVVCAAGCAQGLAPRAALVVVCGTQHYDAAEAGGVSSAGAGASDYPVADLVQMLGLAGRPGVDDVVSFCFWSWKGGWRLSLSLLPKPPRSPAHPLSLPLSPHPPPKNHQTKTKNRAKPS
jgi:pre-mRNA-splicing helicase BRR2